VREERYRGQRERDRGLRETGEDREGKTERERGRERGMNREGGRKRVVREGGRKRVVRERYPSLHPSPLPPSPSPLLSSNAGSYRCEGLPPLKPPYRVFVCVRVAKQERQPPAAHLV